MFSFFFFVNEQFRVDRINMEWVELMTGAVDVYILKFSIYIGKSMYTFVYLNNIHKISIYRERK